MTDFSYVWLSWDVEEAGGIGGQSRLVSLSLQEQTDTPRTAGVRSRTGEATWTLSRPPSPVERERESESESTTEGECMCARMLVCACVFVDVNVSFLKTL